MFYEAFVKYASLYENRDHESNKTSYQLNQWKRSTKLKFKFKSMSNLQLIKIYKSHHKGKHKEIYDSSNIAVSFFIILNRLCNRKS